MRPTPYSKLKNKPKNLKKSVKNVRWESDEPKKQQRIQLYKKCPTCILVPPKGKQSQTDPKNYKFPICTKLSKSNNQCQFNCTGLLAASRRARLTKKYPKVLSLTTKLLKNWECTKKAVLQKQKQSIKKKKSMKRKKTPMKKILKNKKPPMKKNLKRKKPSMKKNLKRKKPSMKKNLKRKKPSMKKNLKRKKPTISKKK
jgi:hypothetical protein